MNNSQKKTVCIIGGGMSGLFTGALLAKNGYKVTVLEKNHIIGGGLQSFRRGDAVFNTGLQAFGGLENGMILQRLLSYLNIKQDDLNITALNESAECIVWTDKNHCFYLPKGENNFISYLIQNFPREKDGIIKLFECVDEISRTFDYIWLRKPQQHTEIGKYIGVSAEQLIRRYLSDETLISLLGHFTIHHGYQFKLVSALEFGMMTKLMISGLYTIIDGTINFALGLEKYINKLGGEVKHGIEIEKINVENKTVKSVKSVDDEIFNADIFVSAITPKLLLDMTEAPIFRNASKIRIEEHQNTFSSFIVYVRLKDNSFPFINSWIFVPTITKRIDIPNYISIVTPPIQNQGKWAKTMEIFVPAYYKDFQQWEDTTTGKRGNDYEIYKTHIANEILNQVNNYYPGIHQCIDKIYTSSPLTVRDYYNNPQGATFSQSGLFLPVRTNVDNLFLSGQGVMYHTLLGVAVTSIMTAENILGRSLIEEIAKEK